MAIALGIIGTVIISWAFIQVRDFPLIHTTKTELMREAEARTSADCKLERKKLDSEKFLQFLEQDKEYNRLMNDRLNAHKEMIAELRREIYKK